jgi:hypothetical protein
VLRVHVVVEYDGPSLSDTASFVESAVGGEAWDEGSYSSEGGYAEERSDWSDAVGGRNPRQSDHPSFSTEDFASDVGGSRGQAQRSNDGHGATFSKWLPRLSTSTLNLSSHDGTDSRDDRGSREYYGRRDGNQGFSGTRNYSSAPRRRTSDQYSLDKVAGPSGTQTHQESRTSLSSTSSHPNQPSRANSIQSTLATSELGARWIREQTERVRRKLRGPASSFGGSASSRRSESVGGEEGSDDDGTSVYSEGRGNLELVRESNGSEFCGGRYNDVR